MVGVPITISTDFSAGASLHSFLAPPAPPAPKGAITPAAELPIPMAWPPGMGLGTVKKTSTVLYDGGRALIQKDHDCGKLIPQVTMAQPNVCTPFLLLKSSRSVIFSAAMVRANGAPLACTHGLLPLLACGEPVPLPYAPNLTNGCRSVYVGMSLADFVHGLVNAAAEIVGSWLAALGGVGFGKLGDKVVLELLKATIKLTGSAIEHMIDPRYPLQLDLSIPIDDKIKVKVSITGGSTDTANNPSSASVGIEYKPFDDDTRGNETDGDERPGTGASVKLAASAKYTWDDGSGQVKTEAEAKATVSSPVQGGSVKAKESSQSGTSPKTTGSVSGEENDLFGANPKGEVSQATDEGSVKAKGSINNPVGGQHEGNVEHPWGPPL